MEPILVIGSSNTDMVVKTSRFPVPGQTVMGGEFFMFSGGKGANQAVAAVRMGATVILLSKIGNDIFGQRAMEEYKKEGLVTDFITKDNGAASGVALILVNEAAENEIVVAPGANELLSIADIDAAAIVLATADIVLLQLEIPLPAVLHAAEKAQAAGARVILNPAPACALPASLLQLLYLITPNETEASMLTGIEVTDMAGAAMAAEALLATGVQNVIITMGAKGAYFSNYYLQLMVEAPVVSPVDTTAAGDVFNGVLAVALAEGREWEPAIRMACAAAAMSVTRMGAQASMPRREELNAFFS
ncbi:MAG TPA: ribokinase [Chitinophagaceae bacterium]|nr:ribokinase [Chitinophagaceae bacterium]